MVYIKSLIAFYLEISSSPLISTPCHLCIWPKILAIPEFLTLCSYYKPTTRKHIASPCFLIYSGNIAFLFPLLFSHRHLPNTGFLTFSEVLWTCFAMKLPNYQVLELTFIVGHTGFPLMALHIVIFFFLSFPPSSSGKMLRLTYIWHAPQSSF